MKAVRSNLKVEDKGEKGKVGVRRGSSARLLRLLALCLLLSAFYPAALAQGPLPQQTQPQIVRPESAPKNTLPGPLRQVGIDQRLNEQVPLGLVFRDEEGREVELGKYFGAKPVILSLVYYDCPMLCTQILTGLVGSLKALKFSVGDEFTVVTVSFDARETPELARAKKEGYLTRYGREGAAQGWHFLTGDQASIDALTQAVGFRYAWDEQTKQFAHASGIMVLTPEGKLSRYFYGVEYSPKDLRLGLVEASANKIGSPVDQLLLFCYHYDPATGKYGFVIMNAIRVLGVATFLGLALLIIILKRRERGRASALREA